MSERFTISYRDGAYKVSVPNYDGGEVVTAEAYDRLREVNRGLTEALTSIKNDHANLVYQMGEGRVRRALTDIYAVASAALNAAKETNVG